jgi:hypothetical protein
MQPVAYQIKLGTDREQSNPVIRIQRGLPPISANAAIKERMMMLVK